MVLHLFIFRTYLHASLELIGFKEACKYNLHSKYDGLLLNPVNFKTLTMLGDRSFAVVAAQLWNSLSYGIMTNSSIASFKKTFLFWTGEMAIHPEDCCLLGMKWRGHLYVDPFGLRSAPFIFNTVADMMEWILLNQHHLICDLMHYLGDFITAGLPRYTWYTHNLTIATLVCKRLGLPLHPN